MTPVPLLDARRVAAVALLALLGSLAATGSEDIPILPPSTLAGDASTAAEELITDDGTLGDDADAQAALPDASTPLAWSIGTSLGLLSASEPDLGLGFYAAIHGSLGLSESVAVELGIGTSLMKDLYYVGEMRLVPVTVECVVLVPTRTRARVRLGAGVGFVFLEHSQTDVRDVRVSSIQLGAELGIAESGRAFCVLDAMGGGVATDGAGARWDMAALLGLRAGVGFDF
jgi:hypothetical protein